ncbi:tetratricopeptide repeat protein [Xanthomonas translucens]|uniref:tetratricopeptide repeat protein n=1 Tax=Xanthomonas campestris pv. translucens TaxID=343 RepID=UPI000D2023F9|nr:tetratricopeptide repeat protein [Xanthomonas translucens]AVY66294.1 membrane protein [Xanthomonas translucens pv. undulosa]
MNPIVLLSLALQLACCVHVVRSGRPLYWIFILLIFSYLGILIYVIAELLPQWRNDPRARRHLRKVGATLDPNRDTRTAGNRLELADTVDNRRQLAELHLGNGEYAQAAEVFESGLRGIHRDDPWLLLGLAKAQFGLEQPAAVKATLDRLIAANPQFRSHDGHLLYARATEALGQTDAALEEYAALADDYPGEEARVRYAQLLQRAGQPQRAGDVFNEVLKRSRLAPRYYQRDQRQWIDLASRELKRLDSAST